MRTAERVDTNFAPPAAVATWRKRALIVGVLGLLGGAIGWITNADQFYRSYLVGFVFIWGASMGCLSWLMVYHLTGGRWGTFTRRIFEAGTRCFWLVAVASIPLLIGLSHVYEWAHLTKEQMDEHLRHITHAWLNPVFFTVRLAIYFAIWIGLSVLLNRISDRQDQPDPPFFAVRLRAISGIGAVLYALTVTLAAVDLVMSLTPHWISHIFGLIFLNGQSLLGLEIAIVVLAAVTRVQPTVAALSKSEDFLDLGKLLLAMTMVWAYFWFSQYLIIWSGNIPEEVTWVSQRTKGGWQWVAGFVVLFQFAVPFSLMLSRSLKSSAKKLAGLAMFMIVVRWADLYWTIRPTWPQGHPRFDLSWMDIVVPLGLAGIWFAMFFMYLARRPFLVTYDAHTTELFETHGH